jgi:hypothetical protein
MAPFCSERCRNQDLAHWADGTYVISTPADPDELTDEMRDALTLELLGLTEQQANEMLYQRVPAQAAKAELPPFSLQDWSPTDGSRPN